MTTTIPSYFIQPVPKGDQRIITPPTKLLGRILAWESVFLDKVLGGDKWDHIRVTAMANRFIDDEIARNVQGSVVFMQLSINLIIVLMALVSKTRGAQTHNAHQITHEIVS